MLALTAAVKATDLPTKRRNIVMLMTDDTGWNNFGAYSNSGKALGYPTRNGGIAGD